MRLDDREFRVVSNCELLPYLLDLPLGLSRKQAKDLLRFRAVEVRNHASVRHDTHLWPGDVVTISIQRRPADTTLQRHGLTIVHLDDSLVVVDKPAGLLSMGSEREKNKTVHRILNEYLKELTKSVRQQVFIVHRLDRETSGLMVLARSEAIQAALQDRWKDITKRYLAVVEGVLSHPSGTLKDRLAEDRSLMVHRVVRGGEIAVTHYRVIRGYGDKSLLELTLETGRKHQIRVQLAYLGHPVMGDRRYGARSDLARRLALHSSQLQFRHPISGAPMEFSSPLPFRLKTLVEPPRTAHQN